MAGGITLIPSELRDADVSSGWITGIAVAGIVLAIALVAVPFVVLDARIATARALVAPIEARHGEARDRAMAAERDLAPARDAVRRAMALRELFAQHVTWVPFFAFLESRTLPSVRYDSITADATGSVMLPVQAPDVRAAAEQIAAWQTADRVSRVEVNGIASAVDALGIIRGTRFDLRIAVDPSVFATLTPVTP